MSESSFKVKLKLLIDTKNQKVLFAKASKNFVDFLFSLLSLPLGQVVKLVTKNNMLGCIGNLYGSIELLSRNYIQSPQNVESILNPRTPMVSFQNPLLLSDNAFVESGSGSGSWSSGGFVEGMVTYMVMDNLEVKGMYTICTTTLRNTFNIRDPGSLEEKFVSVGVEEGLKILQLSLQSKDVLTTVFLRNPQRT